MARDDNRYIENLSIDFAMYCDKNGLSLEEGFNLAEDISEELDRSAESRSNYLEEEDSLVI